MFGNVLIDKPNILIKDYETYRAYYCGLCKSIGKEYGTVLRLTLNYDIVLLALLGHNYEQVEPIYLSEHCITHPVRKVPTVKNNEVLTRVADINIILGYYKASDDVIDENKPARNADHPTMKPLKLLARLIKNSSRQGDVVLDTFGGSGSTLITCEQLGRKCYTMELDPKYADVIVKRWLKFTGADHAQLVRGGKTTAVKANMF